MSKRNTLRRRNTSKRNTLRRRNTSKRNTLRRRKLIKGGDVSLDELHAFLDLAKEYNWIEVEAALNKKPELGSKAGWGNASTRMSPLHQAVDQSNKMDTDKNKGIIMNVIDMLFRYGARDVPVKDVATTANALVHVKPSDMAQNEAIKAKILEAEGKAVVAAAVAEEEVIAAFAAEAEEAADVLQRRAALPRAGSSMRKVLLGELRLYMAAGWLNVGDGVRSASQINDSVNKALSNIINGKADVNDEFTGNNSLQAGMQYTKTMKPRDYLNTQLQTSKFNKLRDAANRVLDIIAQL